MERRSFVIFCVLFVALGIVLAWSFWTFRAAEDEKPLGFVQADVAPASNLLHAEPTPVKPVHVSASKPDFGKLEASLADGATPTQDVGERGSLNGALYTDSPITYHESKYERLPNSPLYLFTDDMIWRENEDTFAAKKDALVDQSRHIQEASIALSVSPRVEYGKTTGYRLVEIPEGTIFSKMGMISGDVVVSINGALPDMEPMALMFVNMAAGKQGLSTIVVDHRGVERTIHLKAVE